MVYFGGGEGENIVNTYKLGWVAESGNYEALNKVLNNIEKVDLELKTSIQQTALKAFNIDKQMLELSSILQ